MLLFENGTYYAGTGSGIATINVTTGQITPRSSISGGPGSPVGLAPDPLPEGTLPIMLMANAYMLGTAAPGVENPFGTVDLNSGAFTLIGNMGSGGYDGLAVANGVLYTEQNGLLYSVNTTNANLTLIGGLTGNPNLNTFGSTTTGLYGVSGAGSLQVATLFSINPQTGAISAIGPIGASAIPNGQSYYERLSVGSSTLYMESNSNLYTINTTTGVATQVGTTDSNGYLSSVLLLEYGTYYAGTGSGIATINITTGQIAPHSSIFGGPGSPVGLAPDPLITAPVPVVNAGGVVNSGSYTVQGVAPGSIVSVFGTNLAASTATASTTPLPTALSDVTSVTFNNIPAGLYFVSQNQINAQVPFDVLPAGSGTVNVVVTRSAGTSAPQNVTVAPASPGIFTTTANGLGQAFAYDNATGAVAAPAGTVVGSFTTAPISVSSGHALIIACTGLGAVTPSIDDYVAASDGTLRNTLLQPAILIGGVPAQFRLLRALAPIRE